MAPIPGTPYHIYAIVNGEKAYLGFSIISIPISPKFYTIVGYRSINNPRVTAWTFTPMGGDDVKLYSTEHPRAAVAARGSPVVVSEGAADILKPLMDEPNAYSISGVSSGVEKQFWTLPPADTITQLRTRPFNGHPNEVFYLEFAVM